LIVSALNRLSLAGEGEHGRADHGDAANAISGIFLSEAIAKPAVKAAN
jgi:hypothetical protein